MKYRIRKFTYSWAARLAARRAVVSVSTLGLVSPAFAQLSQANTFLQSVATALEGVGVVVCTIAILWAAFKLMFQAARFTEISHIFIGAMLAGGAATFAGWMFSGSGS
ncbi:TrbC/VirB2 family protein [Caballeronia sp. KNU42]